MIEKEINEMKVAHGREMDLLKREQSDKIDELKKEQLEIRKSQLEQDTYINQQKGGFKGIGGSVTAVLTIMTQIVALVTLWVVWHKGAP
jgi:hypothetical protein